MYDLRFFLKLGFGLSALYFLYAFSYKFGLGLIYGMTFTSFLFLFPSPIGVRILDKVFNYSNSLGVIMKNESEKNNSKSNENKVKFGRN